MRLFKEALDIENDNPSYKLVLSYENEENQTQYCEFDYVDDSVKASDEVSVTQHPIAGGYEIADHIFRQPQTLEFQAKFGIRAKKAYNWTDENRLGHIQSEFTNLMRAGTRFRVMMLSSNNESNSRFRTYTNMIIQRLNWTQHQDTLDADFSMKEAMTVNAAEFIDVIEDYSDPNLPAITDLTQMSFKDEFFDIQTTTALVIKKLQELDLIDMEALKTWLIGTGIAVGGAAVLIGITWATTAVVSAIAATVGATASVVPVGTIVAAAVLIVAAIGLAIWAIIKQVKRQKFIAAGLYFKIDKDMTEAQKQKVLERLGLFIEDIQKGIEKVAAGTKLYAITSNQRQECGLYFDGDYYTIQIEEKNLSSTAESKQYQMTLLLYGENAVKSASMVGLSSIADCTDETALYFKPESNARLYLMNKATANYVTAAQVNIDPIVENDLRNMLFLSSEKPMEKVWEDIANYINSRFNV